MGTGAGFSHGVGGGQKGVEVVGREREVVRRSNKPQRLVPKSAEWIKNKKDQRRKAGKEVKTDSKFSGRKRAPGF
jgi:18S rRNA (guanine1575-N7)-methyltransferase